MKTTIRPCLWFDGDAEEAAEFYAAHIPDSRVDNIVISPADNPSMSAGGVLTVEFTLAGQRFLGLNGGPQFKFTEAVSFVLECEDQDEVNRLWSALQRDGGEEIECGWLRDRWGLFWQVVPRRMFELLSHGDPDVARRAMEKMMTMKKLEIAEIESAAFQTHQ